MNTQYQPQLLSKPEHIRVYAEHYLNSPEDKISAETQRDLQTFVSQRYHKIKRFGIQEVRVSGQPYANADELFIDFEQNHQIQVSTEFNHPVVLDKERNLQYRFLHDFDHCFLRSAFDWMGENQTCYHLCSLTSNPLLRRIIRSEIVYQAAAYFYLGDFPDTQKLVLSDPRF